MARRRYYKKNTRRDRYGRYRGTGGIKPWKQNNPNWARGMKIGQSIARSKNARRMRGVQKAKKGWSTKKKVAVAGGAALAVGVVGGAAYGGYKYKQSRNAAGIVQPQSAAVRGPRAQVTSLGRVNSLKKPTLGGVPGVINKTGATAVAPKVAKGAKSPRSMTATPVANPQGLKVPKNVNAKSIVAGAGVAQAVTGLMMAGTQEKPPTTHKEALRQMEDSGFVEVYDPGRGVFYAVEQGSGAATPEAIKAAKKLRKKYGYDFSRTEGGKPVPPVRPAGTTVQPIKESKPPAPIKENVDKPKTVKEKAPAPQAKAVPKAKEAPKANKEAKPKAPPTPPKVNIPKPSTFTPGPLLIPNFKVGDYGLKNAAGSPLRKFPSLPMNANGKKRGEKTGTHPWASPPPVAVVQPKVAPPKKQAAPGTSVQAATAPIKKMPATAQVQSAGKKVVTKVDKAIQSGSSATPKTSKGGRPSMTSKEKLTPEETQAAIDRVRVRQQQRNRLTNSVTLRDTQAVVPIITLNDVGQSMRVVQVHPDPGGRMIGPIKPITQGGGNVRPRKAMTVEQYRAVSRWTLNNRTARYDFLQGQIDQGVQLPASARSWIKAFEKQDDISGRADQLGREARPTPLKVAKAEHAARMKARTERAKEKRRRAREAS